MFIPILAAIVFLGGAAGLVLSSLAPIVGDGFFNFASICLIAGPLIFFCYVMVGLCLEFVAANRPPIVARAFAGCQAVYAPATLSYFRDDKIPEGLLRERKGPLNPSSGRAPKI